MTAKELIDLFDSKNGTRVLPIFNYVSEHYPTFNHPEIDLGDELFKALTERDLYYKALCDIESGKDVRMILERVLT